MVGEGAWVGVFDGMGVGTRVAVEIGGEVLVNVGATNKEAGVFVGIANVGVGLKAG